MARLNDNLFTTLCGQAHPEKVGDCFLTALGWVKLRFSPRGLSSLVYIDNLAGSPDPAVRNVFLEWLKVFQSSDLATQWSLLDLDGTEFQKLVWRQLLAIPFAGHTSYGAIAKELGRPKAYRAVGAAVGRNPISLLIPCHRVLPRTGKLGNYRWGVDRKRALLDVEQESGSDYSSLFQ